MTENENLPKFYCIITEAMEDFDSGVWEFFRWLEIIEADIGCLMFIDTEWKENYIQLLSYLSDLSSSIISKRKPPDSEFLKSLVLSDIESYDPKDLLINGKGEAIPYILKTGAELDLVIAQYIKLAKIPRFSEAFSMDQFDGIRLLTKAIYSRAIVKSQQK